MKKEKQNMPLAGEKSKGERLIHVCYLFFLGLT
jgi:hypothetical protein